METVTRGSTRLVYAYDTNGRTTGITLNVAGSALYTRGYTYYGADDDATGYVQTVAYGTLGISYTYTYDGKGNITSVSDGTNTTQYTYDSANQLIREDNQAAGKTWVWTYDNAGNILKREEYAYTTGTLGAVVDTVNYTYGDSDWGDLLTAYDGVAISYDTNGNPLSDGTWTYTWEHGRQLASMTTNNKYLWFKYDANGMRTTKTVQTVMELLDGKRVTTAVHDYVYNGSLLTQYTITTTTATYPSDYVPFEPTTVSTYTATDTTTTTRTLYFTYDASGRPVSVSYTDSSNSTVSYYYITNLQGDVVAIVDSTGTTVVQYAYDAWGKLLSTTGTMANTLGVYNPLRYRGYVYDYETSLYYLQSRYYDPEVGRFLNADAFVSTGQGNLGNNMFAYCLNNPVILEDTTGTACRVCITANSEIEETPWRDTASGGRAGIYGSGSNYYGEVANKFYIIMLLRYLCNTDEQVVLDANYVAFYKGSIVIKVPIGDNAFSFGFLFIGDGVTSAETVQHEYGHYCHMKQIGIVEYALFAAIPSLVGFWTGVGYADYFSLPWEYVADKFGGVNRDNGAYQYHSGAEEVAAWYWFITLVLGEIL